MTRRHRPQRRKTTTSKSDEMKADVINVRVTRSQKRALVEAAERESLGVSVWLRRLGLQAAIPPADAKQ